MRATLGPYRVQMGDFLMLGALRKFAWLHGGEMLASGGEGESICFSRFVEGLCEFM